MTHRAGARSRKAAGRHREATPHTFPRMLGFVRPYTGRMFAAGFCLSMASLANLVFPGIVRELVDGVFVHRDERALNTAACCLVGVFALQAAFNYCQTYLIAWIGERIVVDLRNAMYSHLQSLSMRYYGEQRTGELMSRLTNDVDAVQNTVSGNLLSLLQQIVTLLGSTVIVFVLDWHLALLMLAVSPSIAVCGAVFGRRLGRLARLAQEGLGIATTLLEETLANERVVQAFGREGHEIARFDMLLQHVFSLTLRRIRVRAGFIALVNFLTYISITLVLWFGSREVMDGRLTPGGLISFLFYIFLIAGPLGNLANIYAQAREALGAAERIFEVLDTPADIVDAPDAITLPRVAGSIAFERVHFSYVARVEVLRSVSFTVEAGQMVALVGPSGAGKTTIASLIPRFFEPTGGRIAVDGVDVRQATSSSCAGRSPWCPRSPCCSACPCARTLRTAGLKPAKARFAPRQPPRMRTTLSWPCLKGMTRWWESVA